MTLFTFKLPDIGEGIAEAEIVAWHVKVGDRVGEDQPLADMMTDKATVEIESPVAGVVKSLAGEVGDKVPIGGVLVEFEAESGAAEGSAPEAGPADTVPAENAPVVVAAVAKVEAKPQTGAASPPPPKPEPVRPVEAVETRRVLASPAVRARAKDLGIDLAQIKSDGEHVRHADIDAFLRYGTAQGYLTPHTSRAWADETVKVIGLRRRIAENMAAAKRHIPHFTYVDEIDVTRLEEARADLNANRGERPKLTVLPLLVVAICRALPRFPMLNARYDDEAGVVTRSGSVHLGIATQTDAGLMVPVVREAQDMNVWQLASEISRLAEAARDGTATSAELSGSTLTLTSLGPLGGIATTPIINRPEVAIIGPNKIVERPVFAKNALGQDELRRAKLMNLSISCDHRVVDGWDAASFVQAVKALIETPVLLFAEA
ncbi:MAG: branched-chain alpha-keto acid dehydrogenase subunit [Novosphingobium sp.]|nr:branched-chain alpha-keto acid dehydrogenase subunit [Novosphingobium sp.]